MTEFGKSELFTAAQLRRRRDQHRDLPGHPAAQRDGRRRTHARRHPVAEGSQQSVVGEMQTRARLYELLDYQAYNTFDSSVYNFTLETNSRAGE